MPKAAGRSRLLAPVAVGLAFGLVVGFLFTASVHRRAHDLAVVREGGQPAAAVGVARGAGDAAPCHRSHQARPQAAPGRAEAESLDALLGLDGFAEAANTPSSSPATAAAESSPARPGATPRPPRRTGHPPYATMRHVPHSAECGIQNDLTLFIAVLAAPTGRSRRSRQVLRDTWFKLADPRRVAIRFFLALDEHGNPPADVTEEADTKQDIVFVDTRDAYKNLFRKVNLIFKWICDKCPHVVHILKTDDDSFVRVDKLLDMLGALPKKQLYYGSFLRRMPARTVPFGGHGRAAQTPPCCSPLPAPTPRCPCAHALAGCAGVVRHAQ